MDNVTVNVLPLLLITAAIVAALLGAARLASRWPRVRFALLAAPFALGATFAVMALTAPDGYSAAYSFGGVWLVSIWIAGVGLLMTILRASRRAGVMGLLAALVALASFYAVYLACYGAGLYAWKNAHPVPIPPTSPR